MFSDSTPGCHVSENFILPNKSLPHGAWGLLLVFIFCSCNFPAKTQWPNIRLPKGSRQPLNRGLSRGALKGSKALQNTKTLRDIRQRRNPPPPAQLQRCFRHWGERERGSPQGSWRVAKLKKRKGYLADFSWQGNHIGDCVVFVCISGVNYWVLLFVIGLKWLIMFLRTSKVRPNVGTYIFYVTMTWSRQEQKHVQTYYFYISQDLWDPDF